MADLDDTTDPPEPAPEWLVRAPDTLPVRSGDSSAWLAPPGSPADLEAQVLQLRALTTMPATTAIRRGLFMWLRIFVLEHKASGKQSRVNMRLPIPIPLLGLLLPWRMSNRQALALLNQMYDSADGAALAERALASHTAFEFIHVEETNPRTGSWNYVVMGLE